MASKRGFSPVQGNGTVQLAFAVALAAGAAFLLGLIAGRRFGAHTSETFDPVLYALEHAPEDDEEETEAEAAAVAIARDEIARGAAVSWEEVKRAEPASA